MLVACSRDDTQRRGLLTCAYKACKACSPFQPAVCSCVRFSRAWFSAAMTTSPSPAATPPLGKRSAIPGLSFRPRRGAFLQHPQPPSPLFLLQASFHGRHRAARGNASALLGWQEMRWVSDIVNVMYQLKHPRALEGLEVPDVLAEAASAGSTFNIDAAPGALPGSTVSRG